ncbi:MAG TPA: DUF2231 domain-containing protein [Burkholderiaceae bacterium]|nr:DUF2231 domain-containing protein [Burkholderiaceae bacterium]
MTVIIERRYSDAIHPFHAIVLAGIVPLFVGAALCDWAYMMSFHIQWSNFASWLNAGGLVVTAVALVLAVVDVFRFHRRARGVVPYFVLLLATWAAAFVNALFHARDAWAAMPGGMILSVITAVLAVLAVWLGFNRTRTGVAI